MLNFFQACAFRDSYEKFKKAGAVVVGISGDDPASHRVRTYNQLHFAIIVFLFSEVFLFSF